MIALRPRRRPRLARRLHRDERGLVAVIFLFVAVFFVVLIGMVWNTSRIVSAKMRAQAAADDAALAAATWTSRTMNLVTSTNMIILRLASAEVSARATRRVIEEADRNIEQALLDIENCGPPGNPCITRLIERLFFNPGELLVLLQFVIQSGVEAEDVLARGELMRQIRDLHALQRGFVEALPDVIEEQRALVEAYHGVELLLAVPGRTDGRVTAPIRPGDAQSFERVLRERRTRKDNALPRVSNFSRISGPDSICHAQETWDLAEEQAIQDVARELAGLHYVLVTQLGGEERSPATTERDDFTVCALALVRDVTDEPFMLRGIFDADVSLNNAAAACAQAETFNGYDERLARLNRPDRWPFRLWTHWGWNWQPRLTNADLVGLTMITDEAIGLAFEEMGLDDLDAERVGILLRH